MTCRVLVRLADKKQSVTLMHKMWVRRTAECQLSCIARVSPRVQCALSCPESQLKRCVKTYLYLYRFALCRTFAIYKHSLDGPGVNIEPEHHKAKIFANTYSICSAHATVLQKVHR